MEKLIVIANLGRVRPVKYRSAGDDPHEKAHLFEESGDLLDMRPEQISAVVTDQAGRFSQSGPTDRKSGMSYGEEHHLKSELERKSLERVAGKIGEIVTSEGNPAWRLVFPQTGLANLVKVLPASARKSLVETTSGDLTGIPLAELEKRFMNGNS